MSCGTLRLACKWQDCHMSRPRPQRAPWSVTHLYPACGHQQTHFWTGIAVQHIEFDAFLQQPDGATFDPIRWRAARAGALATVCAAVQGAPTHGHQRTLVLVDDNGYYRSMRRNVLRIAQQGRVASTNTIHYNVGSDDLLHRPLHQQVVLRLCSFICLSVWYVDACVTCVSSSSADSLFVFFADAHV